MIIRSSGALRPSASLLLPRVIMIMIVLVLMIMNGFIPALLQVVLASRSRLALRDSDQP